jgi:hypothetical protein
MRHIGPTIEPALYNDHGRWQVVQDETCFYLPKIGPGWKAHYIDGKLGYWLCRLWCLLHGYGWLPVI